MTSRAIVGRGPIVAALDRAVDDMLAGRSRLVLLAGEPGIGKTTLADRATAGAAAKGAAIGWGTCWDGDGVPAFWAWRQVLRSLGAAGGGVLSGDDPAPDGAPTPDARFRLFAAVADALRAASDAAPVVVVLDDLHWADPGTLRLLAFLVKHLRSARLLVIGAYRDVDPQPSADLRAFLAEVATEAEAFAVGGLSADEVAQLLGGPEALAPGMVAAVHARTGGNPLFAQETARLIATDGDIGLAALPPAVRDTIDRRVSRLAPAVRKTLAVAAIMGATFPVDVLADACRRDHAAVAADLEAAADARIVTGTGGRMRFGHDLFRETLAAGLDAATRRRVHRQVGDALRRHGAGHAELAHHFANALPDVDARLVVDLSAAAARDATANLAYEEATAHLRRAVRLAGPDVPGELRWQLAEAARRSGDYGEARAAYRRAAEDGGADLLARAALGRHFLGASSDESHREVIELLERARAASSGAEPSGRDARLLAALAREHADGIDADRGRAAGLAERAVAVARAAADRPALAFCLFALHDVVWAPGTAARRLAIAQEMAGAAGDDPEMAFEAALCRFIALVDLGDARFDEALRDLDRLAAASRLPRQRYLVLSRRATVAILRGDYAAAERLVDEATAAGEMIGHPDTFGVRVTQLLTMGIAREGLAAAPRLEREFGSAIAPAEFAPEMRAFAAIAAGRPELAAAIMRSSAPGMERARFRWRALGALAFDAEIAVVTGAVDLCEPLYETMLPYAGEMAGIGGAAAVIGPCDLYLGLLAGVLGRPAAADAHLRRALDVARGLGAAPLAIRVEAAMRAGRPEPATFRRAGDVWTLAYAGTTVTLPDAKGLHDIAALLAAPGADVPAVRLLTGPDAPAFGSDEVLDATARAAYQRRLAELDDDLDAAASHGDPARVEALTGERTALVAELAAATGLGGRSRRLGDPGERARTTVTARIRDALRKIESRHPELGTHLRDSLETGRSCRYAPTSPVRWTL